MKKYFFILLAISAFCINVNSQYYHETESFYSTATTNYQWEWAYYFTVNDYVDDIVVDVESSAEDLFVGVSYNSLGNTIAETNDLDRYEDGEVNLCGGWVSKLYFVYLIRHNHSYDGGSAGWNATVSLY